MIYLLLFTLPAAALFAYWHPRWAARRDWKAIQDNGSKDSLKENFHFMRGVQRGILQTLVSVVAAAPLLPNVGPFLFVAVGVGVASLGHFFAEFNPKLSNLRSLRFDYVSSDPQAAYFPDRYVWGKASAMFPTASTEYVRLVAGKLYRELLTKVELASWFVGGALLVWGILKAVV